MIFWILFVCYWWGSCFYLLIVCWSLIKMWCGLWWCVGDYGDVWDGDDVFNLFFWLWCLWCIKGVCLFFDFECVVKLVWWCCF